MDRIEELNRIVEMFDLNSHPFYTAWSNGTLPVQKLQRYAADYAEFIGTIPDGWSQAGEPDYAEEERFHHTLWNRFTESLRASGESPLTQTKTLLNTARSLFSSYPECIGALYAFESQQPRTARAKLDGLKAHYRDLVDDSGQKYFDVHADDTREVEFLHEKLNQLDEEDYARSSTACAMMCTAMWHALDGYWYTGDRGQIKS